MNNLQSGQPFSCLNVQFQFYLLTYQNLYEKTKNYRTMQFSLIDSK